jgi:hypothetical protein
MDDDDLLDADSPIGLQFTVRSAMEILTLTTRLLRTSFLPLGGPGRELASLKGRDPEPLCSNTGHLLSGALFEARGSELVPVGLCAGAQSSVFLSQTRGFATHASQNLENGVAASSDNTAEADQASGEVESSSASVVVGSTFAATAASILCAFNCTVLPFLSAALPALSSGASAAASSAATAESCSGTCEQASTMETAVQSASVSGE